ncbi:MAG TPA: agmatinase [Candidatus Bipolaricaulota bacterium]
MANSSFCGIFKPASPQAARFALLGAPYDAGSSFRPGARLAPASIRQMASSLNACSERGLDLSNLNAVDRGDLPLNNRVKRAFGLIEEEVGFLLDAKIVPVVLGGDHSVTVPCFKAALARYPKLRLLYFDAHPDLYADFEGDPYSHACVVSRILELEGASGKRMAQWGIRASTPAQEAAARKAGMRTVCAWDLAGQTYASDDPVYVSFDIDVLDPSCAPGCGNPVPGGLSMREALNLIHAIKAPIACMDVVEVNPLLDPSGISALAAARVAVELVANQVQFALDREKGETYSEEKSP